MADNESNFDELQARVVRTLEVLAAVQRMAFEGKEERDIQVKTAGGEFEKQGLQYLQEFALPNFFFHVVTAYGILRAISAEVGKRDYPGGYVRTY
jgi:uncharacterized protein